MGRRRGIGSGAVGVGVVAALAAAGIAGATTAPEEDVNAWALEYTGSPGGAAEGEPIRIGYANSEPFAPESTVGVRAAVEYVNAELGGAGGRPIEIVECPIVAVADGAACGAQFANDDSIALVITGTLVVGNKELYDALNGNKPLIIGNGLTVDDFVTPAGQSYTAGAVGRRRRDDRVHPRGVPAGDRGDHRQRQRRRTGRRQRAGEAGRSTPPGCSPRSSSSPTRPPLPTSRRRWRRRAPARPTCSSRS